jgi:ATP-dependent DNA helicase DinG
MLPTQSALQNLKKNGTDRVLKVDAPNIDLGAMFAAQGPLARAVPNYHVRVEQIEMAQAVLQAIEHSETSILEAGTGVGKTAAYLVPALLYGGKVIVSTGTKALQDQLFNRDLPHIQQALALPVKTALLKGRSNYLCWYHLDKTNQDATLLGHRQEVRDLGQINRFIHLTQTGDKAECAAVPESASVWSRVTSTRDNCLGNECSEYQRCFVVKARREAQDADIVVVNHHLFFADLMLREEGVQELLPNAQTLIFDEAHQLPDTATLFFGHVTSSGQLLDLLRDTKALGLTQAREACDWPAIITPVDTAIKDLRLAFDDGPSKWSHSQLPAGHALWPALDTLRDTLTQLRDALSSMLGSPEQAATVSVEAVRELSGLHRRSHELLQALHIWGKADRQNEPELCWVDVGHMGWQLHRTPISVADIFKRQRLGIEVEACDSPDDSAWEEDGVLNDIPPKQQKAWIFTSATLAVKQDFTLFQSALGLQDATCKSWSSPYNYGEQALLYVPKDLPLPQSSHFTQALVDKAMPLIAVNEGRAFMLCTSLRGVDQVSQMLKQCIESQGLALQVLTQGDGPRPMLLDEFRRIRRAVLVGSHSFWEGIDVKGDALTLVIIDKLPFAPPDEPILARRLALLAQQGGNSFMEYQVPQAIIALKQGAGRLIRSENDKGVLMIGDTRLIDKPYGRRIWQSLPPMRRSREQEDAIAFLNQIKPQPS